MLVSNSNEWVKGVFNSEDAGECMGILHIRPEISDWLKTGEPVIFGKYAQQWLEVFAKPHLADLTYNNHRQQLYKHILPAFGDRDIRSIDTIDLQIFLNERSYLKLESQRKLRGILNMIFAAALEDEIIQRNPVRSPRLKYTNHQKDKREALNLEDMAHIQAQIGQLKSEEEQRYLAIQCSMALRPCEVLGLRWEDVDLDLGLLHIRRNVVHPEGTYAIVKGLKTETSYRSVPISALARPYLEKHDQEGFIVGGEKPLDHYRYRCLWKSIKEQIDLHGATPYVFRHTVLTDLYDATKDVKTTQLYAGHGTPDMTMRRYVHGRGNNLMNAGLVLDNLYRQNTSTSDQESSK